VYSATNLCSLLKLCCLQQKCDSLSKSSCLQQISIRCQKHVDYSEVAFTVEIVISTAKQFSLPNCAAGSELVFVVKVCGLQRTSFHYWIVWPMTNQFRCWFSAINPWAEMT